MFDTLKNAWKIDELRKKILYTLVILIIYRLGCYVPVPGVDAAFIGAKVSEYGVLGFMNLLSGGSVANYTLFAMGVSPYITSSIIFNLLTVAIPALERLQKEGEEGRKKIQQYTRRFSIVLAFIQSVGILLGLGAEAVNGDTSFFNYLTIGICLTAGSAIVMWLGERITERGIGNGISLIIFIGIVSRIPFQAVNVINQATMNSQALWMIPATVIVAIVIITGVVFVDLGERRVPVQYAKRVVGRKMYGGQSTYIPMKVNSSGVLPIIFAITLLTFPGMIAQFWPQSGFYQFWQTWMGNSSVIYNLLYALLIVFFTYFYTTISFNPVEISKNMQQYGGFIPGIRPGKPTSDYLSRISSRITLFGAIFLACLAVVPQLITAGIGISLGFAATSILIMVSVALETTKQLESQMLMRNYKGFLK